MHETKGLTNSDASFRNGYPLKKKNVKQIINRVTSITREVLTIYSLVKTKNPLSIGLGVISSVGLIYDNLGMKEGVGASMLKERGYKNFHDIDADLIYYTIKHIGLEEEFIIKDEDDDSRKISRFLIKDVEILFYHCDGGIYGPFVKDKKEFSQAFSGLVFDKLGGMIKIEVKMGNEREAVKFSPLDISTNIYISTIDESELIRKLQMFRDMGFTRSLLFHGPPGVGKTTLVGRMVEKMGGKLIILHPDTIDCIEMSLLSLLNLLNPDIILFDDIDRIHEFNDILAYLEELNRFNKTNRLIIGTVNDLYAMPAPMRRPGRFDQIIKFGPPNKAQILEIVNAYSEKFNVSFSKDGIGEIVDACNHLTPAFIQEIVKRKLVYSEDELLEQIKYMKELLRPGGEE